MQFRLGRLVSIAIVLGWAGLVTVHLARSYGPAEGSSLTELDGVETEALAGLTQRGVYYRGSRIGHIRERLTPRGEGYRAEQSGAFTLTVLGRERRLGIDGAADVDGAGRLRSFEFRLQTATGRSPFETTVRGVVRDDELALTIASGGTERQETRPLDAPIVLPVNLYYSLAARGFVPGETYRLQLFDPMTLSDGEATIEVKEPEIVRWGGREEEAHRLQTTFSGLTTTAWVGATGEVLQEETPLGWTLLKEAPGTSLEARAGDTAAPDVAVQTAVPAIGFAGDATDLSSATLVLSNFPDGFDALDGGRQRLAEDEGRLTISREVVPFAAPATLDEDERERSLAADAFVQSDHPAVAAKAKEIAGSLPPLDAARRLTDWVHESLAKSPTLSLPSAVEVLEQRVGDCNEHTILYTALARAAGIPTRISTGLAYTGGQFYYHAWAEVFVDGWVAVDPTFGQFPADPLHVRLSVGGLETQYQVLELLGRGATIEVAEAR